MLSSKALRLMVLSLFIKILKLFFTETNSEFKWLQNITPTTCLGLNSLDMIMISSRFCSYYLKGLNERSFKKAQTQLFVSTIFTWRNLVEKFKIENSTNTHILEYYFGRISFKYTREYTIIKYFAIHNASDFSYELS